ncbi:MAG: metallophosphoesterase [Clostridia bacterium]|nr:metallophosphoesterase [Clostridia bacterium]
MKKPLSLLLALLLVLVSVPICTAAESETPVDTPLRVLVTSDTHWAKVDEVSPDGFYTPRADLGQMTSLTHQIFARFMRDVARSDADFVFITGDLTDSWNGNSPLVFSRLLAKLEDTTGKQIFVVPGNHDLHMNDDPDDHLRFRSIYSRFGWDEALAIDEATSSYTADLKGDYRLLAINSNKADGGGLITDELMAWIEAQVQQANRDGKHLIAMMHHQIMDHFTLEQRIDGFYMVDNAKEVCKKFAQWNIRVTFTGHLHIGDVAEYTGKNTIYDVTTYALSSYPLRYRDVTFTDDEIILKSREISKLDVRKAAAGYSDEQKAMIANDPVGYAYGCQEDSLIKQYVSNFIDADYLADLLGLAPDSVGAKAIKRILPENILIPLYGEGETVESMAKALGYDLPESDYETVADLISEFWAAMVRGDENLGGSSPEGRLFLDAAYALFATKAAKESPAVRALLSAKLIALFGLKGVNNAFSRKFFDMVLTGLMIDKGPADNNVTLVGYGVKTDSFRYKLNAFFRNTGEVLKKVFA